MVYIYKKPVGGKTYYYLRASERKGGKVVSKEVAYLGSSVGEVKISLGRLSQYKDEIRKAYRTIHRFLESNHWLEKAMALKLKKDEFLGDLLPEVEACRLHYGGVFNKLDELTKQEAFKNFIIEFAFNTTSIEGNTINLAEARNLLEEGRTPKDKTLREVYDVQNTERAFLGLLENREGISHGLITGIHETLMDRIDNRTGYRMQDVRVIRAGFDATPAPFVKADMDVLLKWFKENENILHPLALAAVFHHKFERIHPFMDGNGRAGRMLMEHVLMGKGYPPLVIRKKRRSEYLDALRAADKSGPKSAGPEYSELVQFMAEEMVDGYWNLFL